MGKVSGERDGGRKGDRGEGGGVPMGLLGVWDRRAGLQAGFC